MNGLHRIASHESLGSAAVYGKHAEQIKTLDLTIGQLKDELLAKERLIAKLLDLDQSENKNDVDLGP